MEPTGSLGLVHQLTVMQDISSRISDCLRGRSMFSLRNGFPMWGELMSATTTLLIIRQQPRRVLHLLSA